MTSFGSEEDFRNFQDRFGNPLGSPTGSSRPRRVGEPVGIGSAQRFHDMINSPQPIGGGGANGGGINIQERPFVYLNPNFFKPQDPSDPPLDMQSMDERHEMLRRAWEISRHEVMIEFIAMVLEYGLKFSAPMATFITSYLDGVQGTLQEDLLAIKTTNIIDVTGAKIGQMTVAKLGNGKELHSIQDNQGNEVFFDDDSTPEQRQIDLWEFRDQQSEASQNDNSNNQTDSGTNNDGDSSTDGSGNEPPDDPEDEATPIHILSTSWKGRGIGVVQTEPLMFVFDE